ncbi:MAG TPA: hypothetical protein VMF13_09585 [Luteitalea sp.]|nr:hypothetical protein [Luteitalea sp.]
MLRNILRTVLGIALVAGSASIASAQSDAWGGGTLVKVDAAANTVVIKQGLHEQTYKLGTELRVQDGKKSLKSEDLSGSIGRRVTVKYSTDGDARVAARINLQGGEKAAAALASGKPASSDATTPR